MSSLGPPLPTRLSRRTYLSTLGAGCLAALSGCNGFLRGYGLSEVVVTEEISSSSEDDGETDDGWSRPVRLTPVDDDVIGFGASVALADDGTTALISAGSHNTSEGAEPGPAYVVERTDSGWRGRATLVPDSGELRNINFGKEGESTALSADGTTALVGADEADGPHGLLSGVAYVFRRTDESWDEQSTLVPDEGFREQFFGHSVALSDVGTVALIGTRSRRSGGLAYVFERTDGGWSQEARISPDAVDFGRSVALGDDAATAIIGAPGSDRDPGSAYVFRRDGGTWRQQATLMPKDSDDGDFFGRSVTLAGDTALVGASGNVEQVGSAYVFRRDGSTWRQEATLTADDSDDDDLFGVTTALTGDRTTALVGARSDEDPNGEFAGSAYVFERTNGSWSQEVKLAPEDGERGDIFGNSVALVADTAVIGTTRAGAYVY